ncbi:MAG: D-aminoacyl-tRNA deacylase [Vampirovibrionales bacterium]|nr:D-aminoacyl-tRNA deacylase [Vampirovibrionales bacterium]
MKCLIQRVSQASVRILDAGDGEYISGEIGPGMLLFLGFEKGDTHSKLAYFLEKLPKLRIFSDTAGKMNRSILDINGAFLVVSQFTLAGDCSKGNRPSFDNALVPQEARTLYDCFLNTLAMHSGCPVKSGVFGASMAVSLVNDGPVTFMLSQ